MDAALKIFDTFKAAGVEVHFPNKYEGVCKKPYAVVKEMGTSGKGGSAAIGAGLIHIILYVPHNRYDKISEFTKEIKGIMSGLSINKTGSETPTIYDPENKAYTKSIEYQVLKLL